MNDYSIIISRLGLAFTRAFFGGFSVIAVILAMYNFCKIITIYPCTSISSILYC